MKALLIFSGQIWKKTILTLQALTLKLRSLNQTCISSKSIIQLTKTTFKDSAVFIENNTVETRLRGKSEFCGQLVFIHPADWPGPPYIPIVWAIHPGCGASSVSCIHGCNSQGCTVLGAGRVAECLQRSVFSQPGCS